MNVPISLVGNLKKFFGLGVPKIKMSCDGEVLFRSNADIALAFFIVNYLIPKYPDLDFCFLVNRFVRVKLETVGIIDKTRLMGYQVVAKMKNDDSKHVFCFVLMQKDDKSDVTEDKEINGLCNVMGVSNPNLGVLGFYPVGISAMFGLEDEKLNKTQFSEGYFPFELLFPV